MVTTILAFLTVLGVLIFVHELGHFLVARWYGVRVLTFSLGFGPKILKITRGGTEYCISVIPLGGYVKMAGETTQDERTGAPDEFLSKSKWVRFQVYLAGPVMNILLAIAALTIVLSGGADVPIYHTSPAVIGKVVENSPAAKAAIAPGDVIVAVDGQNVPTWDDLQMAVLPRANRELTLVVERAGVRRNVSVTPSSETKYETGALGVEPVHRPQVVAVQPHTPAERAGLKRGDVLLSVDGQKGLTRDETVALIRKHGPSPIALVLERGGQPIDLTVTPEGAVGSSLIGFTFYDFEFERVDLTLSQAFKMSLQQNWESAFAIGRSIKELVTGKTPVRQLMGPLAIADLSGSAAQLGFMSLLGFMALISLNLALLNLMPVPILDGGQIAILLLESVARRDMSVRVKERVTMVGAALILLLMVTVLYNDVARILR